MEKRRLQITNPEKDAENAGAPHNGTKPTDNSIEERERGSVMFMKRMREKRSKW
jgi:hypothetical protein